MTVWVLIRNVYGEWSDIIGVFATEKLGLDARALQPDDVPDIEDHEVQPWEVEGLELGLGSVKPIVTDLTHVASCEFACERCGEGVVSLYYEGAEVKKTFQGVHCDNCEATYTVEINGDEG